LNRKNKIKNPMNIISRVLLYLTLIILAVLFLIPIYGSIITSFKSIEEILTSGFWSFPKHFGLENYIEAWNLRNFGRYTLNSIIITVPSVILSVLIASLAAYPLSRMKFKGQNIIYFLFVAGLFLPPQVNLLPLYRFINVLGIFDTYWALIIVHVAFGQPICVFILRNFFMNIPYEIQDAAKIDGCNNFWIYSRIIMPLAKPVIAVLFIFQFTWIWNDFLWGIILTQSENIRPITVGLYNLQGMYTIEWNIQTAGANLTAIPTILIFLLFQRYFIKGITLGAVKG